MDNALPLPLSNRVYAGHYGEALLVFTRVQRILRDPAGLPFCVTDNAPDQVRSVIPVTAKPAAFSR